MEDIHSLYYTASYRIVFQIDDSKIKVSLNNANTFESLGNYITRNNERGMHEMRLENAVAIITGGGTGIGKKLHYCLPKKEQK